MKSSPFLLLQDYEVMTDVSETLSEPTMQSQFMSVTLLEASLQILLGSQLQKNNILKNITEPCPARGGTDSCSARKAALPWPHTQDYR